MRVFSALGSARKEGNTAKVLGWVEAELRARGHEIDRVDLYDFNIRPCTGCNACKLDPEAPGCIIEDDCDGLLHRLLEADIFLLASPMYYWGFTAQAKALLDRCYAFGKPAGPRYSLIDGKRFSFIITGLGPVEGNLDLLVATFPRIMAMHRTVNAGNLIVPNCNRPAEIPASVEEEAKQLAAKLTA